MSASGIKKERMRQQERQTDEPGARRHRGEIRGNRGPRCIFRERRRFGRPGRCCVQRGLVLRRCGVYVTCGRGAGGRGEGSWLIFNRRRQQLLGAPRGAGSGGHDYFTATLGRGQQNVRTSSADRSSRRRSKCPFSQTAANCCLF